MKALVSAMITFSIVTGARIAEADDDDYDAFRYKTKPGKDYFRALLEDAVALGIVFIDDIRATSNWTDFHGLYQWDYFRNKLTGGNLSFDSNLLFTNFAGHPNKGFFYYSFA